ncbi:MAG TPA: signal recognition particle protein, partial [Alphaproteobacteria bacterium]|nr:signal recognition particle protein [Alphaproteobacteria bacterium]
MFESLTDKIGGIFSKLRGKGSLSENDVMAVSREIRVALLEADVALPVVKDFIDEIKTKAVGQSVIKGVNPGQQVVKIVNDALIEMLGGKSDDDKKAQELIFGASPSVILMVGLQGSGKTTTTAKIGKFLTDKRNKKVLMASLDVYRPAAQEQLAQLSGQTGVAALPIVAGQKPLDITARALDTARKEGYDVLILDTAGRTTLDEAMMDEVKSIQKASKPAETLIVADAMTGQDAVNTAKAFDDAVGLTGIVLTRMDGDARGGAALSMKAVTGKPVKLVGMGEKWDALEPFYAERAAGRILGMGDVVSLVEKAIETVDHDEAAKMAEKFKKGKFDFNDLLSQMRQMNKMGGMGAMMKMMPGMSGLSGALEQAGFDEKMLKWQEAIILSMTPAERSNPDLLNASRKRRIAAGAGRDVQEINRLVKQQKQMETMMKKIKKMGMGGMMKQMKAMMGGKMDEMEMLAGSMGADDLAEGLGEGNKALLGPNPFAGGGLPGGLP